jgi:hypothetical protein
MPDSPNPIPDFNGLAVRAITCCQQWRAWAQREPRESPNARRAFELGDLFQKQASILSAMHRNRMTVEAPTRRNFARPKL